MEGTGLIIETSGSADATEDLGAKLAEDLRPGDIVLLEGDLAAGKTTLVRGMVRGLGGDPDDVSSPTFVVIQSYDCDQGRIRCLHHVDLYRLVGKSAELRETGLEELLSDPGAVIAIEWPKTALLAWLPADARVVKVKLTILDDDSRKIELNFEF